LAFRLELAAAIRYNTSVRKQELTQEAKPNAEVGAMRRVAKVTWRGQLWFEIFKKAPKRYVIRFAR